MGTLTEFYTDSEFSEYPRTVPIEERYRGTVDTLGKATDCLNKCSRGILDLHSIPESSRPEFVKARTTLTSLALIYTSLHFPLAVSVVRDVRDIFNLYAGYDGIKKKTLKAMEKTIGNHATKSADSSLLHRLMVTELQGLRTQLRQKSATLNRNAEKMREHCEELRQEIVEKEVRYNSEHDRWIAWKEFHSVKKVQHNAETSQAAALVLRHSEDVRVRENEAKEARAKKEHAARQGTYGTVAGALGAVTMTGAIMCTVGATAMTGGLLVGAAVLGAGAELRDTAEVVERTAEGHERVAIVESSKARESRERATQERDRARLLAEEADQKMRRAAQDAAQVEAKKAENYPD